ncbi:hypothetical protein FI667_g7610, partial [Globisporangium splendens]
MDPMRALDMQFRTGISHDEVDDFANRIDMVLAADNLMGITVWCRGGEIAKAMEEIKNGTFDPNTCKIPGYKTPEQKEAERQKQKRENWWMKEKLRFSVDDDDDAGDGNSNTANQASEPPEKAQFAANRALAACKERDANDYSVWNKWEPQDPVTQEERAEKEAQLEKQRNAECHVGWCIHVPAVRAYLREKEKHALYIMLQTIELANGQFVSHPRVGSNARERVVGNIVKVLITMCDDRDSQDLKLLGEKSSLEALVDALQMLPDGLARGNVAVLLVKLCRADPHVKDEVRALRGIEMMLSVSQSLSKAPEPQPRIAQTPGPAF